MFISKLIHAICCNVHWCVQGTRRFGSEESEPIDWIVAPKSESKSGSMTQPGLSEMFAYHATTMANTISTSLVVFSRKVWSCQHLVISHQVWSCQHLVISYKVWICQHLVMSRKLWSCQHLVLK